MATLSSILICRIPWTKEPAELQFIQWQRVRRDWSDLACTHIHINQKESLMPPPHPLRSRCTFLDLPKVRVAQVFGVTLASLICFLLNQISWGIWHQGAEALEEETLRSLQSGWVDSPVAMLPSIPGLSASHRVLLCGSILTTHGIPFSKSLLISTLWTLLISVYLHEK